MAFLINIPNRKLDGLIERLSQDIPFSELHVYPDVKDPEQIEFALVWKHTHGSLSEFKNLKAISSFGAGVDSILSDPYLPEVPIARIVDDRLADDMAKYLLTTVQQHKLRFAQFRIQQQQSLWKPKGKRKGNRVGILGLGQLGQKAAKVFNFFDFDVSGWSRTNKEVDGVTCYSGEQGLFKLVQQSDYLICLLPLTEQTKGILNLSLFEQLPKEAVLINVARGEHLVENDLLIALENDLIEDAYLDVFAQEPLPQNHPFWSHPNIHITPHISAVTSLETAATQIIENYKIVKSTGAGEKMKHLIDKIRAY